MSDDLGRRLEDLATRVAEGKPDIGWVVQHGARTRAIRTVGRALAVAAVLGALVFTASGLDFTSDQKASPVRPSDNDIVGNADDLADPTERAATIAVAALHAAGLQDVEHGFDYGETVIDGDLWVAHFCSYEANVSVCSSETSDSSMRVERVLDDVYVRGADGTLDAYSALLEGYTEPAAPAAPMFVFQSLSGVGQDGGVEFGFYWTGAIPSRIEADCRLQAFDEEGKLIYEGRPFPNNAPSVEGARDSMIRTELPDDVVSDDLRYECTDYRTSPPPERFNPPDGEGRVLGEGRLPDDAPGRYSGLTWTVVGWDEPDRWCLGFHSTDFPDEEPEMTCVPRANKADDIFRGSSYEAPDPGEPTLVRGVLDPNVARVVVTYEDGSEVEAYVIRPPADMDISGGYLVVFVPMLQGGTKVAYDHEGNVLDEQPLDRGQWRNGRDGFVTLIVDERNGCLAGPSTPEKYRLEATFSKDDQPTRSCP